MDPGFRLAAFGGAVDFVDRSDLELASSLAACFAPLIVVERPTSGTGRAAASVVVTRNADGVLTLHDDDGGRAVVLDELDTDGLRERLRAHLELALARTAAGYVFVHAGVVEWRGVALLVPGVRGTGKSTLVAALERLGARPYSDEWAVLSPSGLVHALPCPADVGASSEADARPPLPVGCVVATAYAPTAEWSPAVLRGVQALMPVLDNAVRLREAPRPVLAAVGALGGDVVTFESLRPEADEVAPAILDLADAVLDGRLDRYASVQRAGRHEPRIAPRAAATDDPDGPQETDAIHRVPFLRVEDFLTDDEHARLLDFVLANEDELGDSTVIGDDASDYAAQLSVEVRRSRTLQVLPPDIAEVFEARMRTLLPMARQELGIPWFPLGSIEQQLHAHGGGDFFVRHVDNGAPGAHARRLTAVYYFHRVPARFRGGSLYLYDEFDGEGVRQVGPSATIITPVDNTLVVFSSSSTHEVEPVRMLDDDFASSRFTVTLWCREADEKAATPAVTR